MSAVSTTRAGRREWVGLGVIALPCLLYSMDLTVLFLAVPRLTADLRPSGAQLLWITDIYGFLLAGSLVTMGTLGDRIGRRRLLLIGAGGFGIASVLAAWSTSPGMLIAARALLGVAGATLAPSTLALIRNIAQYLQLVLGLSPLRAGLWTLPSSGGFIVGSMLTPLLVRRLRPAFVMAGGLVLAAAGFGVLTQVDGVSGLAVLVSGSAVFSLGLAPMTTLATDLMVGAAPPERAGAASTR